MKTGAIVVECWELSSCLLLKWGKITQNLNPKNIEIFKSINTVKQKVVVGVFKHAESKSGLYFVLNLLLHRFLATFQSKHMTVFAGYPQNDYYLGKTRQSDFLEYTSLCENIPVMI